MKQYKETRCLESGKLRALCIKHDWYTRGTNEEYSALFDRLYDEDGCRANMTTEKLAGRIRLKSRNAKGCATSAAVCYGKSFPPPTSKVQTEK